MCDKLFQKRVRLFVFNEMQNDIRTHVDVQVKENYQTDDDYVHQQVFENGEAKQNDSRGAIDAFFFTHHIR